MSAVERTIRERIFDEIDAERVREDDIHGGPEHDDQHKPGDWLDILAVDLTQARVLSHGHPREFRQKLIVMAAILVAAAESRDRVER